MNSDLRDLGSIQHDIPDPFFFLNLLRSKSQLTVWKLKNKKRFWKNLSPRSSIYDLKNDFVRNSLSLWNPLDNVCCLFISLYFSRLPYNFKVEYSRTLKNDFYRNLKDDFPKFQNWFQAEKKKIRIFFWLTVINYFIHCSDHWR